jgi:hypothetical protein
MWDFTPAQAFVLIALITVLALLQGVSPKESPHEGDTL